MTQEAGFNSKASASHSSLPQWRVERPMIAVQQILLCLLWWRYSATSFRLQHLSSWSTWSNKIRSQRPLSVVINSFADERRYFEQAKANERLLYTIPNSPVPVQSVVSYVHKWALEASATGSSVKLSEKDDGVNFSFSPSPNSYLNVYVDSDGIFPADGTGANVFIRTSFGFLEERIIDSVEDQKKKAQVHSLIKMVAQNLIESLANDIGSLIMNLPSSTSEDFPEGQREMTPQEREELLLEELEQEQAEYDENMSNEDEQNLRSQIYSEQQAEQLLESEKLEEVKLPTEKELMKEWKAEAVNEEENKEFLAEMRIRKEASLTDENNEEAHIFKDVSEFFDNVNKDDNNIRSDDMFVKEIIRRNANSMGDNENSTDVMDSDDSYEDINEIQAFMNKMQMSEMSDMVTPDNDLQTLMTEKVPRNVPQTLIGKGTKNIPEPFMNNVEETFVDKVPETFVKNVPETFVKNVPEATEISEEIRKKSFNVYSWKSVDTDKSVIISYIQGRSVDDVHSS